MKPILISGAGLGGLLFAKSLRRYGIPFEMYERDAHVAVRGQGYRIRLSTEGLDALESVLTPPEMEILLAGTSKTGEGGMRTLDVLTGESSGPDLLETRGAADTGRPTLGGDVVGIARGFLRQQLIKGLEETIHWNKRVVGYEYSTGSQANGDEDGISGVVAIFADGTKSPEGSMLVGADGAHSTISQQLTEGKVKVYDLGPRMIHGQSPASSFAQLGEGVWFPMDTKSIPGGRIGLITNVPRGSLDDPDRELGWAFVGSPGSFDAPGGNFSVVGKVAADLSRSLTTEWHPRIRSILDHQNDAEAAFLKMSSSSPKGVPKWDNSARVTILGDAAHCMTPAGGVGANTALRDAALLGKMLADVSGWAKGVTNQYEEEMRVYASKNVKMSFEEAQRRFDLPDLE